MQIALNLYRPQCFMAAIVIFVSMTAGCGDLLKQPYPAKSYFSIDPGSPDVIATTPVYHVPPSPITGRDSNAATRPAPNILLIRAIHVSPPYDGLALVYRNTPSQYETDYYANWIASPSALLTSGLTEWLDRAGPLPIAPTGSALRPDLMLDGEVTRLLIDRTDRLRPKAVMSMRFFLSRSNDSGTTLLFNTSYAAEVPVTHDDPSGYSSSCGEAFHQILEKLDTDLKTRIP